MKDNFRLESVGIHDHQLFFKDVFLGLMERDVDGFYYFWPNRSLQGCESAWELRAIADILDDLNKEWSDQIDKYFSKFDEKT